MCVPPRTILACPPHAYLAPYISEAAAFAATRYHGHRHVPKTVDQLADELAAAGQKADSKKLVKLIVKQERGSDVMIKDPTKMDPSIFVWKKFPKTSKV